MNFYPLDTDKLKTWKMNSFRILRWLLPILVLCFVIKEIDFTQFKQNLGRTNPNLFFLGLLLTPLLIVFGTLRWHSLLSLNDRFKIPLGFTFKHYWTGLALGFFVPASLGWDAYRVFISGRHFGNYTKKLAIIVVEKIAALVTCMSIIVVIYPLTTIVVHSRIEKIFYLANILLIITLFFLVLVFIFLQSSFFSEMINKIEIYVAKTLEKIAARLKIKNATKVDPISVTGLIQSFVSPKIIWVIILSFSIQFVSALKSQIFFSALGYNIPFIVNLLLAPTLYFIFLLPISFGSIGIREGLYIVLYGLFGVPAEIALLVSFFNLSGMLLNNAIGGVVMLFSGDYKGLKSFK